MSVSGVGAPSTIATVSSCDTGRSIQFMFAKLQLEQSNICKSQAESYMSKIEQAQKDQKECADMIAKARELQNNAKNGTGDCPWDSKASMMPQEMADYFNKHGLSYDKTGNDLANNTDEWDYNIKSLTNYQETLGSYTQTDMVYLQDYMSQYNSFLQGANSAIQDSNDTLSAILRG